MTIDIDFYFDLSSPWTRLAFHNVGPVLAGLPARVIWRPFLVGGVFNAVNPAVYEARAAGSKRLAQSFTWLQEWAELAGVAMHFPSPHHPLKSVLPMRACCVLEDDQPKLARFAGAAFEAYFNHQRNLDDPAVLAAVADECGLDGAALVRAAGEQPAKDRLRANTEAAIARGAFGSPSLFVGEHLYFGNDQLPLLRQRVARLAAGGGQ
ncbi:MAG: 2-hydroxychromene-2-carboxylate isomerase [Proteobacteria bacterium]|nr:2-hydroxychromene-2-carboxylate isomerase [Pseudomonadota bacterium]